uniref:Uncharacterized protein n=1 Tax=Streptomyces sp. NBC_00049 TaxID=2903617 RepID=A0AAU2K1Q8_9ACTN
MSISHDDQFDLAPINEVPLESAEAVLDSMRVTRQDQVARLGVLVRQWTEIAQEYRKRLREALGSDAYEQLRAAVEQDKQSRSSRPEAPLDLKIGRSNRDVLWKGHSGSADRLLEKLEIDPEVLHAEKKRAHKEFRRLLPKLQEQNGSQVVIVDADQVPASVRNGTTRALTFFAPPYSDSAFGHTSETFGGFRGSAIQTASANKDTGLVTTTVDVSNLDAGDADFARTQAAGLVGLWFHMPTTGKLDVWVEAQCRRATHHLQLIDEFGVSDANIGQTNQIAFRAQGGSTATPLVTSLASGFRVRDDDSGSWDVDAFAPGHTFWAHMFSEASFPKGTWVHVEVGTQTVTDSFTNDMEVFSTANFRYIITRAAVGSTGG